MTKRKLDLYDIVVTVCSHYGLTEKELTYIVEKINQFLKIGE